MQVWRQACQGGRTEPSHASPQIAKGLKGMDLSLLDNLPDERCSNMRQRTEDFRRCQVRIDHQHGRCPNRTAIFTSQTQTRRAQAHCPDHRHHNQEHANAHRPGAKPFRVRGQL
jgi:hypothetical protein